MIFGKVRSAAVCAVVMVLTACATAPQPARPAETGDGPTLAEPTGQASSSGGARTSPNVKLVAHLPRTAPLNGDMDWNTDLAFQGDYAFVGNFGGFSIHDISDPEKPVTVGPLGARCLRERQRALARGLVVMVIVRLAVESLEDEPP